MRKSLILSLFALVMVSTQLLALETPPDDEIWYVNTWNWKVEPYDKTVFGANIKEHYFDNETSKGIIKFDGPVTQVGDYAFYLKDLKSISLPNTVKFIGKGAFYKNQDLSEISWGTGLEAIGDDEDEYGAFAYCNCLGSLTLPSTVKTIGRYAFYDCNALTTVTIPSSVTSIGYEAFYDCDVLKQVYLNEGLKTIGTYAFYDCNALESITIPSSVVSLREGVFYDCDKLKSVRLNEGLDTIGQYAFYDCNELESITVPSSVVSLGEGAFYDCDKLKYATIGSGVKAFPMYAFYDCNEMTHVVIDGDGVSFDYEAFYHCDKLESVSFLGSTPPSSFGDYSFDKCSANLKYYVPEELYAKYNSNSFLSGKVVAGPPADEIWYATNDGKTAGKAAADEYKPELNTYMGNHGVLIFNGNIPELSDYGFYFQGNTNLVSIVLPSSVTEIGRLCFYDCHNLVDVSIPNTVTGIGISAFYYCTSLASVLLPDNLNSIEDHAFYMCSALRSIVLPAKITDIPLHTFGWCSELTSMTILGSIQSIGENAFNYCKTLSDIFYVGSTVPNYGIDAFYSCPATLYVKDTTAYAGWKGCPVRSWRSGQGDGSQAAPLEISTYPQLYGFSLEVGYQDGGSLCAKLTADITANEDVLNADGSAKGIFKQWIPIGRDGKDYKGEFDGNGHTISGLNINNPKMNKVGLFGRAVSGASIHNLGVKDSYFRGRCWVAGICGDFNGGQITNCWNGATVIADAHDETYSCAGGIAASCWTNASVSYCHNIGKVSSAFNSQCGGICGTVAKNTNVDYSLSRCYSLSDKCSKAYNLNDGSAAIDDVAVKDAAAFAGGEVCWLLSHGVTDGSQAWSQTLGTDAYPVLDKSHGTVYAYSSGSQYTNTPNASCLVYHPQSEPTCEQRGFTQECWEDESSHQIWADPLCTQELDPIFVVRYAKFAVSPVSYPDTYTIKEDVTYDGVPFHWAATRRFRGDGGVVNGENYSMEFIVNDNTPSYARIKWYKSTTIDATHSEVFKFFVYVNGEEVSYIKKEEEAAMFDASLNGLKKGDIIKINVVRIATLLTGSTTVAAALEYCSPTCGASSDITITPTATSLRKAQGTSDPAFSYTVEGQVFDEFPLQDITVTRAEGETPGKYILTASCPEGANPNYNIRFKTAEFWIYNTVFHKEADAPDCQHNGWLYDCYEDIDQNPHRWYKDALLTQEISRDEALAYSSLTTPCWTPLTNLWNGSKISGIVKDYETQKGYFVVYGRNVADARLKFTIGFPSNIAYNDNETIRYSYHGQTHSVTYAPKGNKTIYAPLENLNYGDTIGIEVPLSNYLKNALTVKLSSMNINISLQYLSDNCGDADYVIPLTVTGTPTVRGKEWDGTTAVSPSFIGLTGCQLVGLDAEDEGKVLLTATAEYDNPEIGDNHTVTVTYGLDVTDESLVGKYKLDESVVPVTVENVRITLPMAVRLAISAAKQAINAAKGDVSWPQFDTQVQQFISDIEAQITVEGVDVIKQAALEYVNTMVAKYNQYKDIDAIQVLHNGEAQGWLMLADKPYTTLDTAEATYSVSFFTGEAQQQYTFAIRQDESQAAVLFGTAPVAEEWDTIREGMTVGEYGTVCLPRTVTEFKGAIFYQVTQFMSNVKMEEVTTLQAGRGYVFQATESTVQVKYTGEAVAEPQKVTEGLQGTFVAIQDGAAGTPGNILEGNYFVMNNQFRKCGGSCSLPPYRAYLLNVRFAAEGIGDLIIDVVDEPLTELEQSTIHNPLSTFKILKDGHFMIIRDSKVYNAQGIKIQ